MNITLEHIQRMTDPQSFKRGQNYFRKQRVTSVAYDPKIDVLRGRVKGSGNNSYHVLLSLVSNRLRSHCTCPVTVDCKHGVALALYWRAESAEANAATDRDSEALRKLKAQLGNTPDLESLQKRLEKAIAARENTTAIEGWLAELPTKSLAPQDPASGQHYLLYFLEPQPSGNLRIVLQKGYLKKDRNWSQLRHQILYPGDWTWDRPKYMLDIDIAIMSLLRFERGHYVIAGEDGGLALKHLLNSRRLYLKNEPLLCAEPLKPDWQWLKEGTSWSLRLDLSGRYDIQLLEVVPPYYLDTENATLGLVDTPLAPAQLQHLANMPAVPKAYMQEVAIQLRATIDIDQLPLPQEPNIQTLNTPIPRLVLMPCVNSYNQEIPALMLEFIYGDFSMSPTYLETAQLHETRTFRDKYYYIERDIVAEEAACARLEKQGLTIFDDLDVPGVWGPISDNFSETVGLWPEVIDKWLPELAADGFIIETADGFNFEVERVAPVIDINDHGTSWFDFSLNLPLANGRELSTTAAVALWLEVGTPDQLTVNVEGDWVQIDTTPLQAIRGLLSDLFSGKRLEAPATLPSFQAAQLLDMPNIDTAAAPVTQQLMDKLANFNGLRDINKPASIGADLRGYQQLGLNWLGFLQEYGFGGILADDMGLGKTLQVLTLIQHMKDAGQLTAPALIVVPTSLTGNWLREAAHFAPNLNTLLLHGNGRKKHFKAIPKVDLVVTSYALVSRDHKEYQEHNFSLLVLDEAQAIKNHATKTAHSVRQINCQTRLCLTGTPMENHLGELWALMDFALPGLLGNRLSFNEHYRGPIEKDQDQDCQKLLAAKVAPFMLRRTKDKVAADLPAKTEILQPVELGGKQRALYEGIRISMEKRIRDLVAKQGMAKSHIAFLDALLKLRQACIDPRLVKLDQAANITDSAKLEWLEHNIPQLLEDGRRILIFSQFTQSLGLIEAQLKQQKVVYSKLTGATRKRQEAIDKFQQGDARVFLISLKAGGAGLNLTAADTVIHLDPWWNPAVENQATDRAYRIGQDKPVFVYKLVATGTVEERIQIMQQKKQALANALFDEAKKSELPTKGDDLLALLSSN